MRDLHGWCSRAALIGRDLMRDPTEGWPNCAALTRLRSCSALGTDT
jgi:hypothetical protein